MAKREIPKNLKDILKTYFNGCKPAELPDPTKLKTVLYYIPDCNVACGEVWACGQAFDFQEIGSAPIEHEQTEACGGSNAIYGKRTPSQSIDVGSLSHELYWRKDRAAEIKRMMEEGVVGFWALQTFDFGGDNETWIWRGFPIMFSKTTTETRSSDPAMISIEIAVDGNIEIQNNVTIPTCGAGDVVKNTITTG